MRTQIHVLTAATLALPVLGLTTITGAAAGAAAPTCHGQQATIVGKPSQSTLSGTDGPDVIVSNGASTVYGRGGDDVICLTNGAKKQTYSVYAAGGDDQVFVRFSQTREVSAALGEGSDTFSGGRGRDEVAGNDYDSVGYPENYGIDSEPDVIDTGEGDDIVVSGGKAGSNDDIDLGAGDDRLELRADRLVDDGSLEGGAGRDDLGVNGYVFGEKDDNLVVDNRTGVATVDGEETMRWSAFELLTFPPAKDATVFGDDRDEAWFGSADTLHARMGAGDDLIEAGNYDDNPASDVVGGRGRDAASMRVQVDGSQDGDVRLDLAEGTVVGNDSHTLIELDGIESYSLASQDDVTAVGTEGDDSLDIAGCTITVRGRGGDDDLGVGNDDRGFSRCTIKAEVYGDAGNDDLSGSKFDDLLQGGPGRDTANGKQGTDRCGAETKKNCERGI